MKPLERFGPEWWAFYATAWQTIWTSSHGGVHEREKGGASKHTPIDEGACARAAVHQADEAIRIFNETFCT